ncbi:MAG TPA: tetratricopeptide repeat protein [Chthoniobacterales bacterium]|nr:tetratricopeptide repeat protein [Chthoniobacterales bacterium]
MVLATQRLAFARQSLLLAAALFFATGDIFARRPPARATPIPTPARALPVKQGGLDDSVRLSPPPDLALQATAQRRADALANFVEAARLEEDGELDAALAAYQKVLIVDPGEVELASRVASLLVRQEDFPRAIDVLKDAIKAKGSETGPYLQLAYIYAKFLQKPAQALNFANQAISLDPENIDGYERVYEIELAAGDAKKALMALDRALKVESKDPNFWIRLGKLYASVLFKPDQEPHREDIQRVNDVFMRAVNTAGDDPAVFKDAADYFAASQQIPKAIPLYLKVLELQPDDSNAREKLATGFVMTNQRVKAIETIREIIAQHPEKFQAYDLLAQLLDDGARALHRENQLEAAKAEFAKAAAAYEQSLLVNPNHAQTYLRLGELLIGALRQSDRAERIMTEGRLRFPRAPEFAYLLALAQREARHSQQAVVTFEEARHEAETSSSSMLNGRFYFDYGVAAEQAGFYDKAADLFRQSIVADPANAAEVYNYLGYMWAEQNVHLDDAEAMVKKALALDPDNGAYLDSLGWVKFRKGRFDEALDDLLHAAQTLKKEDPVVFEHIGDTYAKLGRVPQALEFWQKALTLSPENKSLAEKIEDSKTMLSRGEPLKGNPFQ